MRLQKLVLVFLALMLVPLSAYAQKTTANELKQTRSDLIAAAETYKTTARDVIAFQEQEVSTATKKLEELRQLVVDGLVARNELTAAEQELAKLNANLEATKKQIADSDNLIAQVRDAEKAETTLAQAQAKQLVRPTSMRYNGTGGWSISGISSVQSFFTSTFGKNLPISTLGQSATHNAMGWDHRNAVDVGLHPDSSQGRALIAYLQTQGIPFLAFRGAIPGVSTGPHIHIGRPSHRL